MRSWEGQGLCGHMVQCTCHGVQESRVKSQKYTLPLTLQSYTTSVGAGPPGKKVKCAPYFENWTTGATRALVQKLEKMGGDGNKRFLATFARGNHWQYGFDCKEESNSEGSSPQDEGVFGSMSQPVTVWNVASNGEGKDRDQDQPESVPSFTLLENGCAHTWITDASDRQWDKQVRFVNSGPLTTNSEHNSGHSTGTT